MPLYTISIRQTIAELSISTLSAVYRWGPVRRILFICGGAYLIHPLLMGGSNSGGMVPRVFVFGLLRPEDFQNERWVILSRVSTGSQLDGMSQEAQIDNQQSEIDQTDGELVNVFRQAESAATMERDSLQQIVEMAEDNQFDILGVWKLDRLTRADPWESLTYLERLKNADITLYAGTHGYFDWDDLQDFRMIVTQVVFAREWYERIKENAEEGQVQHLQKGRWPFGTPPFGYEKDEDKELRLTTEGKEFLPEIFETYLETENRAETRRRINDRRSSEAENLTDSQLRTVLESDLCRGILSLQGEVIQEVPELRVVDKEMFWAVQEVLGENRATRTGIDSIPDPIDRASHRFGTEFVLDVFRGITTQCPECEGELEAYGTTTRWERTLKNYRCTDCGYQGPLFTAEEFREIHNVLPLRCPYCPRTEAFEVKEISIEGWEYRYRCENCGNTFATDHSPNKYRRAIENPDCKFSLDGPCDAAFESELTSEQDEDTTVNDKSISDQTTEADYEQVDITCF